MTDDQLDPPEPEPTEPEQAPEPPQTDETPLYLGPQIAARSGLPADLEIRINEMQEDANEQ